MNLKPLLIQFPPDFDDLDEESQDFLLKTLINYCDKAIIKFIAGQKEHGGVIYNRPMLPELFKEQIDGMFYHAGAIVRIERGEKEI